MELRVNRFVRTLALAACVFALSATAVARSSGITTSAFQTPSLGCNNCHSGGAAPSVTLRRADGGSTTVLPGTVLQMEALIQAATTSTNCYAGFNVSSSNPNARLDATEAGTIRHDAVNEVSHSAPRSASSCASPIINRFVFNATMPSTTGSVTLTLWGNSVDRNFSTTGDQAASTTLTLTVATRAYGESCTAGSQCTGGNCVDGVCCHTASCPPGDGQCIGHATCQGGTGTCGPRPNLPAGMGCDDQNGGTSQDQCDGAGHCAGTVQSGTVWSWGENTLGQLGRSAGPTTSSPGRIGSPPNIVQLSTGDNHAAALTSDGRVWTWGYNGGGQLGDPNVTSTYREQPAPAVLNGGHIIAVAAGGYHTLALNYDGQVWAWGSNYSGQLGDPNFTGWSSSTARLVPGLRDVVAIAAGSSHSLALTADGEVWAWGDNYYGQIGDGTRTLRTAPTPVQIGIRMKSIAAGQSSSYAVSTRGNVYVWGSNWQEALGLGPGNGVSEQLTPVFNWVVTVRDIVAGSSHVLAILSDGTVQSWGSNWYGGLGLGHTTTPIASPTTIPNLNGVIGATAGGAHSAFLRDDGTVWVTGSNYAGQLGGAAATDLSVPTRVPNLSGIRAIDSSYGGLFAIEPLPTALSWGSDTFGMLGLGSASTGVAQATPRFVVDPDGVDSQGRRQIFKDMSAGCFHGVALATNGTVWAWGNDDYGQAGQGAPGGNRTAPVRVPGLEGIIDVEAGCYHSAALRSDGLVFTWGYNGYGTLGTGDRNTRYSPVLISTPRITQLSGTYFHMLAVAHTGVLRGWGYNGDHQVNDSAGDVLTPTFIAPEISGMVARYVAAGTTASYVVYDSGEVASWGGNASGELGTGTAGTGRGVPLRIANLTQVTKVSSGGSFAMLINASGALWAFGNNYYGQLGGIGGSTQYPNPILLSGTFVTDVETGYYNTAAKLADGTWFTTGYGPYGLLANGDFTSAGWTFADRLASAGQVDLGGHHAYALAP